MAFENHVILNGQIKTLSVIKDQKGDVKQIDISLMVLRRPNPSSANGQWKLRFDTVPIIVRNRNQIMEVLNCQLREGELLEVSGIFSNKRVRKSFTCDECGAENEYDGTIAYITPIALNPKFLHPTESEVIRLTSDECRNFDEIANSPEIKQIIEDKKHSFLTTVQYEFIDKTDSGMNIRVYSQDEESSLEVIEWMKNIVDISNRIYLMGNVCNTPTYWENEETGTRTTTYQLGVNRKVFIREDDPELRADYPFIKSYNVQADKDHNALRQGSLVFIDGALQARDNFTVKKHCEACGKECDVPSNSLEIVPYAVEYLRNFESLS